MKKELIKTTGYLLVVDGSEIQEGDYRMNIQRGYVKLVDDAPEYYNRRNDVFKKVIAHLPLGNSPILEGVPLLPPFEQEDDEKILFANEIENMLEYDRGRWYGRIEGYNKAREKYKFTEEDMIIIRNQVVTILPTRDISAWWDMIQSISKYIKWLDEYVESLSQPKMPTHFEFKMESISKIVNDNWQDYESIKTTTNSQGQQVVCGKYIY